MQLTPPVCTKARYCAQEGLEKLILYNPNYSYSLHGVDAEMIIEHLDRILEVTTEIIQSVDDIDNTQV